MATLFQKLSDWVRLDVQKCDTERQGIMDDLQHAQDLVSSMPRAANMETVVNQHKNGMAHADFGVAIVRCLESCATAC